MSPVVQPLRRGRARIVALVLVALGAGLLPAGARGQSYANHCKRAGKGPFHGTYFNARYGYLLHYEGGWHKLQIGATEEWFEILCQDQVAVSGEVIRVREESAASPRPGDAVQAAAMQAAITMCSADGPDGSVYCEPGGEVETFMSACGLRVCKFYQTLIREDYAADDTTRVRIGPYYAIDISQEGVNRALLLSGGLFRQASAERDDMVRAIVDELELVASPFLVK